MGKMGIYEEKQPQLQRRISLVSSGGEKGGDVWQRNSPAEKKQPGLSTTVL